MMMELPRWMRWQKSEQRFRKLLEALPDAILVHSENKIVFVNPFCVRLLAAEGPEQLLGKDISEIIHPDVSAGNKKSNPKLLLDRNSLSSHGVHSDRLRRLVSGDRSCCHSNFLEWLAGDRGGPPRHQETKTGRTSGSSNGSNAWNWHRRLACGLDCGTGT